MNRITLSRALRTRPYLLSYPFCTQRAPQPSDFIHRTIVHRSFCGSTTFSSSNRMMGAPIERLDPYTYTSGRWLSCDELERESRFISFDFDALCRKIIELCPDASSITSCDKVEGGFNKVLIFHTDNTKRIVARLPFALAGPSRLTTSSEVATIKYLQAKTSIPIPKILDWSDDGSNAIGSEYIIMDRPWSSIAPAMAHDGCYGSLYFADTTYITGSKLPLDPEFCIGPHCGSIYWDCNVRQPRYYHSVNPNQGPWPQFAAYCDGLIDTGLSRIPPAGGISKRPRYHGSIQTHHELLEYGRAVIREMSKDPRICNAAGPVLFHPDLHKRNIFVSEDDPTIITAIIDWQPSGIEPAFWHADEMPDFSRPISDPSCEDQLEPKSEACAKAYDVCTQFLVPKISEPRSMDDAFFRPFRYCYRTWVDGAVAFREELIQTSRRWNELGLAGSCPFPLPSPNEYAAHQKDYKLFEAAQQLKHSLSSLLDTASDGWVPPEYWEATESAHEELFKGMLQEILGNEHPDDDEPIRGEADLREIWPFDLKE